MQYVEHGLLGSSSRRTEPQHSRLLWLRISFFFPD